MNVIEKKKTECYDDRNIEFFLKPFYTRAAKTQTQSLQHRQVYYV